MDHFKIRVLQRNRTSGMKIHTLFKKVAHTIMETDKSHDLQRKWVSRKPRRADSVVLIQVKKPKDPENQWCGSSLKGNRLQIQKVTTCHFLSVWGQRQEKMLSQFQSSQASRILSPQGMVSLCVTARPSTDCMRLIHIKKHNLLHTVYGLYM